MIPKILGIGAAALAVAFILALPSVFETKPANEVEPIRFGPRPVLKLARAMRVEGPPPPRRSEPSLPRLTPAPLSAPPPPAPVAAPSEEATGETAGAGPAQPPPEEDDGDDDDEDDDGGGDDGGGDDGGDDEDEGDD